MDKSYLKVFKMVLSLDNEELGRIDKELAKNRTLATDEKEWLSELAEIIRTERMELYKKWFG